MEAAPGDGHLHEQVVAACALSDMEISELRLHTMKLRGIISTAAQNDRERNSHLWEENASLHMQLQKTAVQCESLHQRITDLTSRLHESTERNGNIQRDLQKTYVTIRTQGETAAQLERSLEERRSEVVACSQLAEDRMLECVALREQIRTQSREFNDTIRQLRDEASALNRANDELRHQIHLLRHTNSETEEKLAVVNVMRQNHFEEIEEDTVLALMEAHETADAALAHRDMIFDQFTHLQQMSDAASTSQRDQLDLQRSELEAKLEESHQRCQDLQRSLGESQERVEQLREQNITLGDNFHSTEALLRSESSLRLRFERDLVATRSALQELQNSSAIHEARHNALIQKHHSTCVEHSSDSKAKLELQQQLDLTRTELSRARQLCNSKDDDILLLSHKTESLENHINELQEAISVRHIAEADAGKVSGDFNAALSNFKEAASEAQKRLHTAEQQHRDQIAELEEQISSRDSQLNALTQLLSSTNEQCKASQEKAARLQHQLDHMENRELEEHAARMAELERECTDAKLELKRTVSELATVKDLLEYEEGKASNFRDLCEHATKILTGSSTVQANFLEPEAMSLVSISRAAVHELDRLSSTSSEEERQRISLLSQLMCDDHVSQAIESSKKLLGLETDPAFSSDIRNDGAMMKAPSSVQWSFVHGSLAVMTHLLRNFHRYLAKSQTAAQELRRQLEASELKLDEAKRRLAEQSTPTAEHYVQQRPHLLSALGSLSEVMSECVAIVTALGGVVGQHSEPIVETVSPHITSISSLLHTATRKLEWIYQNCFSVNDRKAQAHNIQSSLDATPRPPLRQSQAQSLPRL